MSVLRIQVTLENHEVPSLRTDDKSVTIGHTKKWRDKKVGVRFEWYGFLWLTMYHMLYYYPVKLYWEPVQNHSLAHQFAEASHVTA